MIHIPIALATDNNYIPLVVTLISLIKNADKNTFYDIYILTDYSLRQEYRKSIESYLCKYKRHFSLKYKNIEKIFDNAPSKMAHITRPTFYRLALPQILDEDKCIYLDTDTIIMSDMQELYGISLDRYYVAGVRHPGFILSPGKELFCKIIGIPSIEQYINAGVLVFNLKEMRKDEVMDKFLELIPKNMPTHDQDIINNVCYGKIVFIPFKYNVMTQCADWDIEDYKDIYSELELKEAWNKPCIIHYANTHKPWNSLDCVFMDYWWYVCRRNSIFESIVNIFLRDFLLNAIYHSNGPIFTKKVPRIFDITFKRNYIIYGAGKRAREFIAFIRQFEIIPRFIMVTDLEKNPSEIDGIMVRSIEEVTEILYDKTIIIATRENLQKEIIRNLQQYDYEELLPVSDNWKV